VISSFIELTADGALQHHLLVSLGRVAKGISIGVDPKLVELAKIIGLSRRALIWHVILPGALPTALVGVRYSLGIS
jgi:ABC-type nitrate/sulfonate/bicarbonate transport system permease component